MRLSERIPNLVLFLELDDFFYPFLGHRICGKDLCNTGNTGCVFNIGPYGRMHTIFRRKKSCKIEKWLKIFCGRRRQGKHTAVHGKNKIIMFGPTICV